MIDAVTPVKMSDVKRFSDISFKADLIIIALIGAISLVMVCVIPNRTEVKNLREVVVDLQSQIKGHELSLRQHENCISTNGKTLLTTIESLNSLNKRLNSIDYATQLLAEWNTGQDKAINCNADTLIKTIENNEQVRVNNAFERRLSDLEKRKPIEYLLLQKNSRRCCR